MSPRARNLVLAAVAALIACTVAMWPVLRPAPEHAIVRQPPMSAVSPATAMTQPRVRAPAPTSAPAPALATAALSGDLHPHPITPEREALQQELRLVGALQDALDLEDVSTLRELVARYRAHVPGDENKLGEGYARLADCLDEDMQDQRAARAAAATYYQNERASTLRRYIRRYCLER